MTKITPEDMIEKIIIYHGKETKQLKKSDLVKLYMGYKKHPYIVSEHTLNEKIRTLCILGFLSLIAPGIYSINWQTINDSLNDWRLD